MKYILRNSAHLIFLGIYCLILYLSYQIVFNKHINDLTSSDWLLLVLFLTITASVFQKVGAKDGESSNSQSAMSELQK